MSFKYCITQKNVEEEADRYYLDWANQAQKFPESQREAYLKDLAIELSTLKQHLGINKYACGEFTEIKAYHALLMDAVTIVFNSVFKKHTKLQQDGAMMKKRSEELNLSIERSLVDLSPFKRSTRAVSMSSGNESFKFRQKSKQTIT